MGEFIYHIPTKVYFGNHQLIHLGNELKKYGKNVLLCYGGGSIKKSGLYDTVMNAIKGAGLGVYELAGIEPNPRITSVNHGAEICRKEKIDVVLAVGGGSVIDCAKLIAIAAFYEGDAWDIITRAFHPFRALPLIDISTISGTGSDMDPIGVISNAVTKEKRSFSFSDLARPAVSFLCPELTYSVNKYQTACGSADILSHVIESYFVPEDGTMYLLDTFKEGLMKTVIRYAPIAMDEPDNEEARANLQWAASWAINGFTRSLQNVSWSCHPIEHEISALYDITHGLGLAILTPKWMEYILDETTVDLFCKYGINVFGIDQTLPKMEIAKQSIQCTKDFFYQTLALNDSLSSIGIGSDDFDTIAKNACFNNGTIPGVKTLRVDDARKILEMSR